MRSFLMLAQTYDPNKHDIGGWFVSIKYDGIRCFWDGGVSRGLIKDVVPWANLKKDKKRQICTGLWSRYGNIIHAPDWWLDKLPVGTCLDGELWIERGTLQLTKSYCGKHEPVDSEWEKVNYLVFDSPSPHIVFESGTINDPNFEHRIVQSECKKLYSDFYRPITEFKQYQKSKPTDTLYTHIDQVRLPWNKDQAHEQLMILLEKETDQGGEGLMLRHPLSIWAPHRSRHLLKVKKLADSEARVIGYTWGIGKYEGLMGALSVEWRGRRFQLSGFTDEERQMYRDDVLYKDHAHPGEVVSGPVHNPKFPIGSMIRFRYSGVTKDGIPREARYFR